MKEKGFTLVELISVISILALVILIVTPVINGTVKEQKEKAFLAGVNGIVNAIAMDTANNSNNYENKYVYEEEQMKIVKRDGIDIATLEIDVEGKIEDGNGVFFSFGDKEIYGTIYNGKYCGYIDTNFKVQVHDGSCEEVSLPFKHRLVMSTTTTGDGVYALENGTYHYRGTNPNNYMRLFNGENGLFRIIEVNNDGIMLISENGITDSFDNNTRNDDNNNYCKESIIDTYNGCNAWYDVNGIYVNGEAIGKVSEESQVLAQLLLYYNTNYSTINDLIKKDVNWQIGGISSNDTVPLDVVNDEESKVVYSNKIGIMNVSDYINSSNNSNCYQDSLLTNSCSTQNWLYRSGVSQWTINARKDSSSDVWTILGNGNIEVSVGNSDHLARPIIYLSSLIEVSGAGTSINPYMLVR